MPKWILFRNIGQIDPDCLHIMGASIKDQSNSIGEFGTGLKHSIAMMLRLNIPFQFYNGVNQIVITTTPKEVRGEQIDLLTINGKETSISTRLGKDWKDWYIFREIYSNMIDEGCEQYYLVDDIIPKDMTVSIYLDYLRFEEVILNFNDYFTFLRKPAHTIQFRFAGITNTIKLYPSKNIEKTVFYRKGIRCAILSRKSLYDVDIDVIAINESREASEYRCSIEATRAMMHKMEEFFDLWFKYDVVQLGPLCQVYRGHLVDTDTMINFGADTLPLKIAYDYLVQKVIKNECYLATQGEVSFALVFNKEYFSTCDRDIIVVHDTWMKDIENAYPDISLRYGPGKGDYIISNDTALRNTVTSIAVDMCSRFNWTTPLNIEVARFKSPDHHGRCIHSEKAIIISDQFKDDIQTLKFIVFHELVHLQGKEYDDGTIKREQFIYDLLNL